MLLDLQCKYSCTKYSFIFRYSAVSTLIYSTVIQNNLIWDFFDIHFFVECNDLGFVYIINIKEL